MKKTISLMLSLMMILSIFTIGSIGSGAESAGGGIADVGAARTVLCGDTDRDGKVTILDATTIQRHLASLSTASYDNDAADADGDHKVTILDATSIQRYLAALSTSERVGQEISVQDSSGEKAAITIFNSRMEIQSQMEEMAAKYSKEKGVDVQVYYSSDVAAYHLQNRYANNDPYTISMVGANDLKALAPEHGDDLSNEAWVKNTTQAFSLDGKVYGFPVNVEARGIIYNADAIKRVTGRDFDPDAIKTTADFQALIDELIAGGMENPTGVMKENWSLAAHYFAEVYEQHDNPDAFIAGIKDGSVELIKDEKFNALMDTFDVLKNNNYAKDAAISAEREVTEQKLAEGEIAFLFGGSWDWSVINAYDYSENMGIMPVPNDVDDGSSGKLTGGCSAYFFIDASAYTGDAQRAAARDFLNWLAGDEEGHDFLVNRCGLVPAFSNITLAVGDPLGASVKKYSDKGALIPNYNDLPDDHYAIVGAYFQMYLAGEIDRAEFAGRITAYWETAEVREH